jgi:hypothetical protein
LLVTCLPLQLIVLNVVANERIELALQALDKRVKVAASADLVAINRAGERAEGIGCCASRLPVVQVVQRVNVGWQTERADDGS